MGSGIPRALGLGRGLFSGGLGFWEADSLSGFLALGVGRRGCWLWVFPFGRCGGCSGFASGFSGVLLGLFASFLVRLLFGFVYGVEYGATEVFRSRVLVGLVSDFFVYVVELVFALISFHEYDGAVLGLFCLS